MLSLLPFSFFLFPLSLPPRFAQFSAGTWFEMLRPTAFVLAVLLSAWVLADARRRGFRAYAVGAWTLLSLLSPPIVFPLYLAARMLSRRLQSAHTSSTANTSETTASNQIVTAETTSETTTETTVRGDDGATRQNPASATDSSLSAGAAVSSASERESSTGAGGSPLKWRRALPLLYAAVILSLATLFFLRDYRSFDAHVARAEDAKLFLQTDHAIREYRAALQLENDPHTHKLLGVELASTGRTEEALAEFLAAERGGEPDERLPYHIAAALDALKRPAEAKPYHQIFLNGRLCTQPLPDARCAKARARSGN